MFLLKLLFYFIFKVLKKLLKKTTIGQNVLSEYEYTKTLTDRSRIQMVNEVVALMINTHGPKPEKSVRVKYAKAAAYLFPNLVGGDPETNYVSILTARVYLFILFHYL